MTKERVYTILLSVIKKLRESNEIRLTHLNLLIQNELLNEPTNIRTIFNKLFQDTRRNLIIAKRTSIDDLHDYLTNQWGLEMEKRNLQFDHMNFQKMFELHAQRHTEEKQLVVEEWNHFVQTFGEVTEDNLDHAYDYIEITYESDYVKHAIRRHLYKMDLK
jgi:hypothetical protein